MKRKTKHGWVYDALDPLLLADGPQGRGPVLRRGRRVTLRGQRTGIVNGEFKYMRLTGRVIGKCKHGRFALVRLDVGYCTTVRTDGRGRMVDDYA